MSQRATLALAAPRGWRREAGAPGRAHDSREHAARRVAAARTTITAMWTRGISPPRRRPSSNSWGEVPRATAYDDAPDSARSESQYTDADSSWRATRSSQARRTSRTTTTRATSGDATRTPPTASRTTSGRCACVRARDARARRGRGRGARPRPGGEGDFSEAEVREAFAAFDEDGDGLLDARDVQSFFEALGGRRSPCTRRPSSGWWTERGRGRRGLGRVLRSRHAKRAVRRSTR